MDDNVNILISKDAFNKSASKDSAGKLEIHLDNYECEQQDKQDSSALQGIINFDQNTIHAGKSSKSKHLSHAENQITPASQIGAKRSRNEVSDDGGCHVNEFGLSQTNNQQTESRDSQGKQASSTNVRQSTRNKRQRLVLDKDF